MREVTNPSVRIFRRNAVRCGGCGAEASILRRGRCATCYARWVRARPVGMGASCASCNDRRLAHLRHFELHSLWVVLCHNCSARAEALSPLPRSVDGLLFSLRRDRRNVDRRGEAGYWYENAERRGRGLGEDRRQSERSLPDASALVVEMEMEADFELLEDAPPGELGDFGSITGVHQKL